MALNALLKDTINEKAITFIICINLDQIKGILKEKRGIMKEKIERELGS